MLRERVGELEPGPLARELGNFELPAAQPLPRALVEAVGEEAVFTGEEDCLRHATGRGYVDLARLRTGALEAAPDAVVVPADAEVVARVLAACAAEGRRRRPLRRRHQRRRWRRAAARLPPVAG